MYPGQIYCRSGHPYGRQTRRPGFGPVFHGSWEAFEKAIQEGFDFTQLPDFGQTMHSNIYSWYADEEEAKLWRPLLEKVSFIKEDSTMMNNTNNPFAGKRSLPQVSWKVTHGMAFK